MKKYSKYKGILLLVLAFIAALQACGEKENVEPDLPMPEPKEEEISIDSNKKFVHPGMLHKQVDFNRIQEKVNAGESPWLDGWDMLIANQHASLSYTPSPVEKLIRGGGSLEEPESDNYSRAYHDAAAAYQCAIRWKISNENTYADKAIEILNAWASTCDTISGNSNKFLAAGIYGYQFANAGEIMRDYNGWEESDFDAFKQWMLEIFYPLSADFIVRHNNTCVSHYWANWDLANLANIISIGILCDSAEIYNEAMDYILHGFGNGNWKKAIYYVHDSSLAQLQESGRDQGHSLLCVGLMGVIAQMAWNQGDDLFGYDDNRLMKAAEYTAGYNFSALSVPFETYENCNGEVHTQISDIGRGGKVPVWECIYNHYAKETGMILPNIDYTTGLHRPEGGGGDYSPNSGGYDNLGFGTLMYFQNVD